MTKMSTSLGSYSDVQEVFDRALESPKGVKTTFQTEGKAKRWRSRAYYFRALDRDRAKHLYTDPGDPRHGTSAYDALVVQVEGPVLIVRPQEKLELEEIE